MFNRIEKEQKNEQRHFTFEIKFHKIVKKLKQLMYKKCI